MTDEPVRMRCPDCGCPHLFVLETRHRKWKLGQTEVNQIVRRRECRHCGKRFTTRERIVSLA